MMLLHCLHKFLGPKIVFGILYRNRNGVIKAEGAFWVSLLTDKFEGGVDCFRLEVITDSFPDKQGLLVAVISSFFQYIF